MNVLSINSGADTGGLSIGMKRAFDRCSSWTYRSLIRTSNYIRYPMDASWAPTTVKKLADEADVLHVHNSFRALGLIARRGEDKGLVIYHHGSQFRGAPHMVLEECRRRRAVPIAATLDLWSLAPTDLEWIPAAYNLGWLSRLRQEHYRTHEGLIVAHAPTNREAKGTQALIAAVARLQQSYPLKLLLIEHKNWARTLALKATADIFVDQLLLGYGCNGIEAMGMGIPVISGVDVEAGERLQPRHPELRVPPGTMDAMVQHWGELPFLHATQATIESVLETMLADPKLRSEYADRGRSHVERFHVDEVVVPQLESVYERSLELRGVKHARQAGQTLEAVRILAAQGHEQDDGRQDRQLQAPEEAQAVKPDVVYVVRPGEKNEELRYSLRSLANLPHGKVWIAGYCPSWVTGVGVIATQTKPGSHVQVKDNLRAACAHPEVSEQFVYMNDDFFVMDSLDQLPVMHRGPMTEAIRTAGMASAYMRAMKQTLEILTEHGITDPLMYDIHAPMLVTKAGMLEALDLCSYPMVQERTLFGNLQGVGGEKRHNHKVQRQDRGWHSWSFLSTNDHTFRTLPAGEYIRSRFPMASPYETAPPVTGRTPTPSTVAPVPRTPIRRHAGVSTIRRVRAA